MRRDVYNYVRENQDFIKFIRENPQWYRRLTRNPDDLENLEIAALQYFKKSIPDRVGQISQNVQLASIMMELLYSMNQNNSS